MEEDDDEDFVGLFFAECEELLADLQSRLDDLQNGDYDSETINAAFRAVHSVKGGAAAFGFDGLITFAHTFENVMDLTRSGKLEITEDLCALLLRSGDVMELLIEKARDGDSSPSDKAEKVLKELKVRSGVKPADEEETSESESSDTPAETASASSADTSSEPETAAVVGVDEPAEQGDDDDLPTNKFVVSFQPDDTFFKAGHDLTKVMSAARKLGLSEVRFVGEIKKLEEFYLDECPYSWELDFVTTESRDNIEAFLDIYEAAAQHEFLESEEAPKQEPAAKAEPVAPAEVEPEKPDAPAEKPLAEKQSAPVQNTAPIPAKSKQTANAQKPKAAPTKSLRVDLFKIDRLVNLVGEIVITQASLAQKITEGIDNDDHDFGHSVEAIARQTRELQESVMAIRAQPVKTVFSRLPRVVRDLCDTLGKDVRLTLEGEQTEVDATVIEELYEPLTHMLRNSMDHGIETAEVRNERGKPTQGEIHISAAHRGERVIITIKDDGNGINRDAVLARAVDKKLVADPETLSPEDIDALIFHPGFSTAETVSSVSGRGVGMDVVRKKIMELGGRVTLKNHPGKGSTFNIALPLTLAVLDGMTVSVGSERFILPLSNVVEAVRLTQNDVQELPDKSRVLSRRGEYLRLLSISQLLRIPGVAAREDMAVIVDTETEGEVAFLVDDLLGQRQVVLKSLEANFKPVQGVSGATILGDGHVALILDIPSIVTLGTAETPLNQETVH